MLIIIPSLLPCIVVSQHSKLLDAALMSVDELNHSLVFGALVHLLRPGLGLVDHLIGGGGG